MQQALIRPVLSFHLAFGLDWLPLISSRAASAARRIARQRSASHIVLDGEVPASFGYGLARTTGLRRGAVIHSAAQNMARLYPTGSIGAIISLDAQSHWLVALHEGAVMAGTDSVYRSHSYALDALQALQRAHPRLAILQTEAELPSLALIAGASDTGTALKSTGHLRRRWVAGLLLLLVSCLAIYAWAGVARVPQSQTSLLGPDEIRSRWNQALSSAEQGFPVHGVAATHQLLQHIHAVPAVVAGWAMTRVVCRAQGRSWQCNADYDRRHRKADNQGLLSAVPTDWRLDFPTLNKANAAWGFDTDPLSPQQRRIDSAAGNRRHLQSAWQGIAPAFNRMLLGPARPVQLAVPHDAQGKPLPRPAGMRSYDRRTVEFDGPLRSFSLLLPHLGAVGWHSITLSFAEHAQASLLTSRFRATLHGDLYELHEADSAETGSADGHAAQAGTVETTSHDARADAVAANDGPDNTGGGNAMLLSGGMGH